MRLPALGIAAPLHDRLLSLLALWMFFGAASFLKGQEPVVQSLWRDATIHSVPPESYGNAGGVRFLVSNDSHYLHLRLVFREQTDQQKVLLFGNTLRMSGAGDREGVMEIAFPVGRVSRADPDRTVPPPPEEREWRRNAFFRFDSVRQELVDRAETIGISGLTGPGSYSEIPSDNPLQVHGWMAVDDAGDLLWELVIPLDLLPHHDPVTAPQFRLEAETGCLDPSGMRESRSAEGRSGNDRRSAAGPPQGFRPMTDAQRQELMERRRKLMTPTILPIGPVALAVR